VHQHPVVVGGAAPVQFVQAIGHGLGRAWRRRACHHRVAGPLRHAPSPGATTTSTEASAPTLRQRIQRVQHQGPAGQRLVLLGPAVPARLPVPAHGSTAWNRTGESGGWAGMGMGGILESSTPLSRAARGVCICPTRWTLPKLTPGKRFALPRPPGSADALLLARLAEREKQAGRRTGIVTSGAADAQRLIDELAFFAPDLRWPCSRTGRRCPTTPSRRTRT
jgi:hypothetical protein